MDIHLRGLQIVGMQARHINGLARIEKLCFSKPWSYDALAEELANPLAVYYVAELDNQTVGYAGMQHIIDEGYINNIGVDPAYRRRGIATLLLRKLDEYAVENGLKLLTLEVRRSNLPAVGIYLREGFDEQGVRPGFYQAPDEDALIMTKHY